MRAAIWGLTRAPEEPDDALSDAVRALARRYDAPVFLPHLTIVGTLSLPDEASVRAAAEIVREAARACPRVEFEATLTLEAGPPQHSADPLRAVVLPTSSPPELLALRSDLIAALTARGLRHASAAERFTPHFSLLYGDLPETTREQIVALARVRALTGRKRVTSLALASAGGPDWSAVSRWRVLATAALLVSKNMS